MKLEIKHLAPYLPYRLKIYNEYCFNRNIENELIELNIHGYCNVSKLEGVIWINGLSVAEVGDC